MPRSLDNALNALDSRLRALRREDGPVLMLDAIRRHLLGAAGEEPASTESRSASTNTQALPQRSPKSSRDRSFVAAGQHATHPAGRDSPRSTAIDANATNTHQKGTLAAADHHASAHPDGTLAAITPAERATPLLARDDAEDQIAAAWLYAWAYNALRPRRDSLAARITDGAKPDHAPTQRATRDPAIDRSVETITSKPQNRAARRRRELDPDRDTGRLLQASGARRSLILGDTLVEDRDNALSEDEGSVLSPPFYRRR
jgi:hypothetical protein